jgi:alpha-beta hydrolase superfamily lysophospholipase
VGFVKRAILVGIGLLLGLPATTSAEGTVVLLHGLARSERSMRHLASHLREAGFEAHSIAYESTEKEPAALALDLQHELARCCREAERVHFVTHSLGGVMLRAVLRDYPVPNLGRVVMLAPPNRGSELADVVRGSATLRAALGPTAAALGTDSESLPNRLPAADFEVGVIAGTRTWSPLRSWLIPADDDGTVSVASTRLEGMADFVTLPVSHTFILRSREAARQTLAFLTSGRFDHTQPSKGCGPS